MKSPVDTKALSIEFVIPERKMLETEASKRSLKPEWKETPPE